MTVTMTMTMTTDRIDRAITAARALGATPWQPVAPVGEAPSRAVLLGDPQTSLDRFMAVLDAHGLLGDVGRLRPDVALVSAGDHFDYGTGDRAVVAADGLAALRWLADHPPDRVVLLAGNHDLARVSELARITDEDFARARSLACAARDGDPGAAEAFAREFPDIPTPQVAWRDYSGFTEAQRTLVQSLLVAGRLHLARALRTADGDALLATHAGVTVDDLALLGIPAVRDPARIAEAIEAYLAAAVGVAAGRWSAGERVPLELAPLHTAGTGGADGREGAGLLYHRPASRTDPGDIRFQPPARRYEPGSLPRGLTQACGHTGHAKCRTDLAPWATPAAMAVARGGLRTLRSTGAGAVYEPGVQPPEACEATLYLVDAEMHHVPAADYPALALDPASIAPG